MKNLLAIGIAALVAGCPAPAGDDTPDGSSGTVEATFTSLSYSRHKSSFDRANSWVVKSSWTPNAEVATHLTNPSSRALAMA